MTENTNLRTLNECEQEVVPERHYGFCTDCKQPKTYYDWCKNCSRRGFEHDFNKWTSGNKYIDKFIQETQQKARCEPEVIEWIPYNKLRNIKYLTKGGFSTIYRAIWLDAIDKPGWGNEFQICNQDSGHLHRLNENDYEIAKEKDVKSPLNKNEVKGRRVILKSLNDSSNINDDFLNEWRNCLRCINSAYESDTYLITRIFGITQDPETSNYMIVMKSINRGNLRSNLLVKKYNQFEKYRNLMGIAISLLTLHKCNLVHGDFHSGNILLNSRDTNYLSDFGLSRPVNQTINSNEIFGVIPYMAPEILRGKPYTKAADIYSFGIIMWEFTSGIPAFNDRSHDFDLSLDICRGLRPKIVEGTLPVYVRLMKRCWDSDPNKRPTTDELVEILSCWYDYYPKPGLHDRIPVPINEPTTKSHPSSCYTSRKIDYSAKLDGILNQEELSSKFVIDEERNYNNEPILSESLENCKI
ncbi:Kic1p [Rhizophagus irregularis DAOM 197198w]|uniref:Kic1p n=2 Tax=Rhizophagus irregularis TaxID=588596 RepID=A0A015MH85_RHIIW|nr:Kic1p [Rhizophagus irregularis DAOM 197198w]